MRTNDNSKHDTGGSDEGFADKLHGACGDIIDCGCNYIEFNRLSKPSSAPLEGCDPGEIADEARGGNKK